MRILPRLALFLSVAALISGAVSAHAQTPSAAEIGSLKLAIGLVEKGKGAEALATSAEFKDPAARKLIMWLTLRTDWRAVGFDRAAEFLRENPDWPSTTGLLRQCQKLVFPRK
jgi:soluble lytic murein transglycosylase